MNKENKNLLVFGYGLSLILAFIGTRLWVKHGLSLGNTACLTAAGIMLVLTVFNRPVLKIIYTYWMKAAGFIGHTVTLILLTLIFYLVFGVVGIVLRFLKKDLLDQSFDPLAESYWHKRDIVRFDKDRTLKQF